MMNAQAATNDYKARKAAVDRVQQIVAEQQPFIYLVHPNVLCAVSTKLDGVQLSVLSPVVLSDVDNIRVKGN